MFESKSKLLESPKDLELLTIKDITAVSRCQGKPSEEKLLVHLFTILECNSTESRKTKLKQ